MRCLSRSQAVSISRMHLSDGEEMERGSDGTVEVTIRGDWVQGAKEERCREAWRDVERQKDTERCRVQRDTDRYR